MKKVDRTNCELGQFKNAINNISFDNSIGYDLEWIFERTNSSDKKILPTKYLQSNHPELVGDTAVGIVLRYYEVFQILSSKKVGLHDSTSVCNRVNGREVMIPITTIVGKHYDSLNIFSDPRYKLPNILIRSMLSVYRNSQNIVNPPDTNGITLFHVACMANDVETIKVYLDTGVPIDHPVRSDSPHFPGYTPLHFAVKCCSVQAVQVLLDRDAKLHLKDAKGMSALHVLLHNHIETTAVSRKRFLLKLKEELDSWNPPADDSDTHLRDFGCYSEDYLKTKSEKMLHLFLDKYGKKNMLIIDDLSLSYSHVACALGDRSLIATMNVASMNNCVNTNSPLWPGYSPLHFAALSSDAEFMKELMEKGGNIGIKNAEGVTPFDICVEAYETEEIHTLLSSHPTWKNILFSDGTTRLLDVVAAMKWISVETLPENLDIHIPHDSPLWSGFTPMHLAILFSKDDYQDGSSYCGESEMRTCVLSRSPNSLCAQTLGVPTPLDFAYRRKNMNAVRNVLSGYGSLDRHLEVVDDSRLSCLHVASATNDYSLVQQLLSWGNNVNVVYNGEPFDSANSGWTPLHFAVANHSHFAVEILCRHGANVLARDASGMTPIHASLVFVNDERYNGQRYAVESLLSLSNFEDVVVDDMGLSHLHVACFYGLEGAAWKLVERGADIDRVINCKLNPDGRSTVLSNITEFDGSTPLHLALRQKHKKTVKSLLQLGADVLIENSDGEVLICDILTNPRRFTDDLTCLSDELFFSILIENDDLRKRLERDIGLTLLHVACRKYGVKMVEELLDRGADVNAQIHANSPIWPGCTPLHVLKYDGMSVEKMLKQLCDGEADVTLADVTGKTAVHVAFQHRCGESGRAFLKAQRDFSVNPTSVDGLSYFHVACGFNDLFIAKKLLKHAEIDVNQRIDYFTDDYSHVAGCTPLHLAVSLETSVNLASRLEVVDLLLKHGADVHAEDACGNTPLNRAVKCHANKLSLSMDLLERLVRAGADVNTKNIFGESPLEHSIKKKTDTFPSFGGTFKVCGITSHAIKTFLKLGCCLNEYNQATGRGYLALALSHLSYEELQVLITAVHINYPNAMRAMHQGRTVIHNIVSDRDSKISVGQFAALIDQLSTFDCNVDDQDEKGQTALHLAVHHQNVTAVCVLIFVGADMGIRDSSGKVALAHNPKSCLECDSKDYSNNESKVVDRTCDHDFIYQLFLSYAFKLKLCGSDNYMKLLDEYSDSKTFGKADPAVYLDENFQVQFKQSQNLKIGSSSVRFRDFLSETGVVIKYATMSAFNREAIDDFFSSSKIQSFSDKFGKMTSIIRFQYRKAVKRRSLMEASKNVLVMLTGYRLPDLCSEYILQLLRNFDLENLVASMV